MAENFSYYVAILALIIIGVIYIVQQPVGSVVIICSDFAALICNRCDEPAIAGIAVLR